MQMIGGGAVTEKICPVCGIDGKLGEIRKKWGILYTCNRCKRELYTPSGIKFF